MGPLVPFAPFLLSLLIIVLSATVECFLSLDVNPNKAVEKKKERINSHHKTSH